MKTLAMAAAIDHIVNILRDHECNVRCAVHEAWIHNRINSEQDSMICEGISTMFDAVVEAVEQCQTPDEIDRVMQQFESAARALTRKYNLPCQF